MSPTSSRTLALAALLAFGACEQGVVDPAPVDGIDPTFSMHGGGEYADVMVQGGMAVYAKNGAHIVRQPKGLRASVTMPTPEPGTYVYPPNPPGIVPGHPEVFTLWIFAFNHPELCTDGVCDGDDLGAGADAKGSVYNGGGHVVSGKKMTISGRVAVGQDALAPAGVEPTPLTNPAGAEIHLAVTSHGGLDPSKLPNEFRSATGSGACGCWWVALFK
jgi:hypothetical protein